jgi:competence protein ComEA
MEKCRIPNPLEGVWLMRPQVSRPVRYAVLTLVVALGAGLLWLGVVRLQAEKRAAAAADLGHAAAAPAPASASASPSALPTVEKPGAEVLVHVAGAVTSAGVFTLEAGARVADAVAAAGGALPGAMPDALNLAARVNDGDKIYVPTVQEAKEAQAQAAVPTAKAPAKAPATATASVRPVNINTASVADLDRVTYITPTLAKAIVAYRVQKGPFRQLDELTAVKGVDRALLEKLKPRLTF